MNIREKIKKEKEKFLLGIGVPERAEFIADDFQKQAIDSIIDGNDTLVVAPTGSGKTYIAIQAIEACLNLKKRVVYTTPLKALSNSKYNELKARFRDRAEVGILTGDRKIDTKADVVVATTEIFRNELYQITDRYSLVILDEVHYISDSQRGPVWEESIILCPKNANLLMLSASISNHQEIADWITDVRGQECKIVRKTERSVELRFGFLHPSFGILPLYSEGDRLSPEVRNYYLHGSRDNDRDDRGSSRRPRRPSGGKFSRGSRWR